MRITSYKTELENGRTVLVKEKSTNYEICDLAHPSRIADMMRSVFRIDRQSEEYVYAIAVNAKMKPIGVFEISHGVMDACMANPREIFIKLLLCGACHFVLVHNHPSQDVTPSAEDVQVTKRLKECGELLGVSLIDHIIIGQEYYSFHEYQSL